MIRIDAAWLATSPLDICAGTDTALARVVKVFGAAHPHIAYLFVSAAHRNLYIASAANTRHKARHFNLQGSANSLFSCRHLACGPASTLQHWRAASRRQPVSLNVHRIRLQLCVYGPRASHSQ